ncbi:hypothetical protein HNR23_003506 [Nocardiopsis mwathae]|uniref:DUF3352 domain-containing protein n=1 Tax=Nocardiopsis mwathae TaxID=1472723 RepID=A0A7W9YKY5_9ACTN|nr:DUF3352 domain-containing protein [Nocardiopsis mwathae]MBB6173446.1 hypothetical protein [Nocardiopsis mwathae]
MSYPDPPNQPSWVPPGPPTGGQPVGQPGYPMGMGAPQPPQYAAPRKNRIWMVPVAAGLGVALMASTVWAANSVVGDWFGGPQPESVLPASSIAFAKLDMKPSGGQLANYAQLVNKLPDEVKDEIDPATATNPARDIVEKEFEYLDYEHDVEPWLGKRFGFAMWESDAEAAQISRDGTTAAFALAVTDEDAARKALQKVEAKEGMAFEFRNDFAIIAPNGAAISDLDQQVATGGTLDGQADFSSDMAGIGGDTLATAWMDFGELSRLESRPSSRGGFGSGRSGNPFQELTGGEDVEGRVALSLKLESDYVELRGDMFGVKSGDSLEGFEAPEPGLEAMSSLPNDTVMAVGGSGLDSLMEQVWKENPDEFGEFEDALQEEGASLPEGFTQLLGSKSAFGITDVQGSFDEVFDSDFSFQFRATGADGDLLESLAEQLSAGTYGPTPGVNEDGDAVVVSSGAMGTGKLGDDAVFTKVMEGTEDSHVGFYFDLRQLSSSGDMSQPEQWGAFGAAMNFDGSSGTVLARWAPSADA